MNLSQLLRQYSVPDLDQTVSNLEIKGISSNSAKVSHNHLFVAIPGYKNDGHQYINDAIHAGACAIVGEKDINPLNVPYFKVENSRLALAEIANEFYQTFTKKRTIIGITGTNGKTTTSFMIKHILEDAGFSCSLFGTIHNVVNGDVIPTINTTLDALELHRLLSISEDDVVIIEVSSHGLSQYRLEGIEFDYCIFTNLDHEHLDYHQNMEEYFSVKASLFAKLKCDGKAIINSCNGWGEKLTQMIDCDKKNIFTLGDNGQHHVKIVSCEKEKSAFGKIVEAGVEYKIKLNILGIHNIYNAAIAFLTARAINIPANQIIQSLESFQGVPGRFDIFKHPNGATVVVDYAHTADAFSHCLNTAHEHEAGQIIHIFGFRGNRDESKRIGMINMSNEISDQIILTFDDLNETTPEEMAEALQKLGKSPKSQVIPDRTLAILHAVENANPADWIFITGKGFEKYQQKYSLPTSSDDDTVRYVLNNRIPKHANNE